MTTLYSLRFNTDEAADSQSKNHTVQYVILAWNYNSNIYFVGNVMGKQDPISGNNT